MVMGSEDEKMGLEGRSVGLENEGMRDEMVGFQGGRGVTTFKGGILNGGGLLDGSVFA